MELPLHKKALKLSYFTVTYNIIEGVVSILGGLSLGSIALVSFGLDSFFESFSSCVLIWRFRKHDDNEEVEQNKETKAVRLIAITFFILGVYVVYEAVMKLYRHEGAEPSLLGIIISLLSICIMIFVFRKKFELGKLMHSHSLMADSKQTLACILMSVTLLIGAGLNYLYGIWWTDGVTALIIALFLFKEGYESFSGHGHHH